MGILDELKQQADQARLAKEQEDAKQAELDKIYQTGIRPAMLNIHKYLLDLTEQLATVTWAVMLSFDIPGLGKIDKLEQRDYSVAIDSQRNPKLIILRFDCVAPEERRYSVASKSAVDDASQFLLSQKVPFSDWAIRDSNRQISGYAIQARLRVRCSLAFEVDLDSRGIRVTSYNYNGIEDKTFLAGYQSIDEEWLDQLGHYILRKNTNFGKLNISEAERNWIRLMLEEEKRRYDEAQASYAPKEERVAEDGLLPKIRKLFTKPTR